MSAFETLIYEKEGALALVTLNRPRLLNAFNIQMRDDLFENTPLLLSLKLRPPLFKGK